MPRMHATGVEVEFNSVDISFLTAVTLPDEVVGEVQLSTGDDGGVHRWTPGFREPGTLTVEAIYDVEDTGYLALRANRTNGAIVTVFVTLPSRATAGATTAIYRFEGFCTSISVSLPQVADEPATYTAAIKVDGDMTLTNT